MTHSRAARRYALALVTLAEEQKKLTEIGENMLLIKNSIQSSRELQLLLTSPIIRKDKKRNALEEIFKKRIDELTLQFLLFLVSKGRENVLLQIIEQYQLLVDEKLGVLRAEVRSTVDFNKRQEKKLVEQLEGYTTKNVKVRFSVDRSLIGGFLARVGDTVFDASIKRQLELLRDRFVEDGKMNQLGN